jgi:hypothetical protein
MTKLTLALVLFTSAASTADATAQAAAEKAAFKINPTWLATYYYSHHIFVVAYTLTLTAPRGVLEGRIRSTGTWNDPRRLFNFRLIDTDVLEGDWESDPVFERNGERAKGSGTFRAYFRPSNGNSFYIAFKSGDESQMDTEIAEWGHFWIRKP